MVLGYLSFLNRPCQIHFASTNSMFLSQHDRPRDNIVAEVCQQSSNLFRGYVDVYDVYGNICGTI